jgi:hypothetical protein
MTAPEAARLIVFASHLFDLVDRRTKQSTRRPLRFLCDPFFYAFSEGLFRSRADSGPPMARHTIARLIHPCFGNFWPQLAETAQ